MIRFDNVTYAYPFQAEPAVRDVSFTVRPGELVLCTGVSGCGKSTLTRLANGLCPQYYRGELRGRVTVGGFPTATHPLHELADVAGTLFQNPEEQFFALGVEDELVFAHEWRGRSRGEIHARLDPVVADFCLGPVLASSVHELSEGQKQKVGLASVLSQRPQALILDEPTANLDPEATAELAAHLARLRDQGMAILVVDHRLYWLEGVADRVMVMDQGRIVEHGPFSLLHDDALRKRHGLRKATVADPRQTLPDVAGEPALDIVDLHFRYPAKAPLFSGASCRIGRGVTAVIGDNGTGKTTLARLLTGLNKAEAGTFSLNGRTIAPDALLARSSIVLQNADHQLYMRSAVEEVATCLAARSGRGKADKAGLREKSLELLGRFGLHGLAERHPHSLSGGEKQRLVIACALAKDPEVLILDEPTSGLDGRNMRRMATVMAEAAKSGTAVLVITHDLELMDGACDAALRLPLKAGTAARTAKSPSAA